MMAVKCVGYSDVHKLQVNDPPHLLYQLHTHFSNSGAIPTLYNTLEISIH